MAQGTSAEAPTGMGVHAQHRAAGYLRRPGGNQVPYVGQKRFLDEEQGVREFKRRRKEMEVPSSAFRFVRKIERDSAAGEPGKGGRGNEDGKRGGNMECCNRGGATEGRRRKYTW